MIDHRRLVQRADHVGGSGNRDPEYGFSESTRARETFDLRRNQAAIERTRRGRAEERQTRGRHNRDALTRLASKFRVTAELALDARQQIFMAQRRQAHRDRVDEDYFVPRARKLTHEVGFRVWMVIPPVFTTKADD